MTLQNLTSYRILIADDEPSVVEMIRSHLVRHHGFQVATAQDGQSAVDLTKTFDPHIMLLDIHMPKLMGWEVVRAIRKFNSDVKIIIISAYDILATDGANALDQGVSLIVRKPASLDRITEIILGILGKTRIDSEPPAITLFNGRPGVRDVVHALANVHMKIRMQCENCVSEHEDGCSKEQALENTLRTLKSIMASIDESRAIIEKLRGL